MEDCYSWVINFLGETLQNALKKSLTILLFVTLLMTVACSHPDNNMSLLPSSDNKANLDGKRMKQLPETENPLVLRTDFSNQSAWEEIRAEIQKPVGIFRFRANVEFIDDTAYQDITKEQLLQLVPEDYNHNLIMVVDQVAISHPELPLLIIDLYDEPGREFRAIPSQIQGIENNLSIANMGFYEFAELVDEDGIFRGIFEDED